MSAKQDGVYTRTASDLERKYQFGKTFSEIIGLIDETREDVEETTSGLKDELAKQSTSLTRSIEEIKATAKETIERTDEIEGTIATINNELEQKMTATEFSLKFKQEVEESGVSVAVGYTFDKNGLKITDNSSYMENTIDESGMRVKRNGKELLTATNDGVVAYDLHAKTYLIIGEGDGRSRFEDYEDSSGHLRTGCFWIGG